MIIDIHCHILPGVDDGARDARSTIRMLKIAKEEGIGAIIATPHYFCGMEKEKVQQIQTKFSAVSEWWKQLDPEGELYLGSELFYGEGLVDELNQGYAPTMNGTKYVLVEFPEYVEFPNIQNAIRKLRYGGYIPIIAHIERYDHLQKQANIQELVDMGAYMQSNASAILGRLGYRTKRFLLKLMKCQLLHFVGTDAHGAWQRRPQMLECVEYMEKKLGMARAHQILEENPKKMLKGERIYG